MSTTNTQPTRLAFFGATGDTAGHALATALLNSHPCTALARTPSNLTASLSAKGVSKTLQDEFLKIIPGDVRSPDAVAQTLTPLPTHIISGIGPTAFELHWNPLAPIGLKDSTICREASAAILAALPKDLPAEKKPLLINISTTGIPSPGMPRDVPILWLPLYRWLLHYPHVDKGEMEANLRRVMDGEEGQRGIRGYVNVKPTLLTGGEGIGWEKIRAGGEAEPALGYFVARKDVGEWIFWRVLRDERDGGGFVGGAVTLAN